MKTLITAEEIANRIEELAREITAFYQGKALTAVVTLNGAMPFASDLLRKIRLPMYVDTLGVSSYVNNQSSGKIHVRSPLKLPVKERHVLLIDDILDTGCTLANTVAYLKDSGALSVRSCVLLDKETKRSPGGALSADWYAFRIPDVYVAGYGLDADEYYRNLPDIKIFS